MTHPGLSGPIWKLSCDCITLLSKEESSSWLRRTVACSFTSASMTRTAKDGALPIELLSNSEAHDAWFRAKVREALEDERPDVDDAAVEAQFAECLARKLLSPMSRL